MKASNGKKGTVAHENLLGLLARGLLRHTAPEGIISFSLDFFLSTNLPFLGSTCSIFLFDTQQNELVLGAHRGSPERVRCCHKNLGPGQCLCGKAAREKKVVFDPQAHLYKGHLGGQNGLPDHGDVCIPLLDGEQKLVGVLHGVIAPGTELADDVLDFLSRAGADIGAALGQSLKYKAALEWNQDLVEVNEQLGRQIDDFTLALAHAQEAKTDFLVSMNHELRTPLNPIIGFAQVLLGEYFGELNSKQKEHVQDILDSGKRLLDLIDEILDLSRAEMGRDELNLSPLNILDLTTSMLKMVKEKAFKHSITIDVSIDEALEHLEIIADETKLKTVVYNLLSNAVKFTPDGGAIQLGALLLPFGDIGGEGSIEEPSAGKVSAKTGKQKPWLEIFVQDSGYGIAKEDKERIFDEFYQVRNSSMQKPSGSGLGLPLARRFVAMHGGRIWMESEGLGKGSRFVARIPIGA